MNLSRKNVLICVLQTLLFMAVSYYFWYKLYPAHLHFHEQFQLFQYSGHYFCETLRLPGGFAHYISRFLVQFFYHAEVGAAVMTLLLTALQLLTFLQFSDCKKQWAFYPLTFLPALAVWMFLLNANAMPVLAVNLCLALAAAWLGKRIKHTAVRWGYEVVMSCLLFILAGGNGLLFTLLMAGHEAVRAFRNGNRGIAFMSILIGFALFFIIPALGTYLYPYPYEQLLKGYATFRFALVESEARMVALVVTMLTVWLLQSGLHLRWKAAWVCPALWLCVAIAGFFMLRGDTDLREESGFCYDYLVRTEQWDEIIRKADRQKPASVWEQCCLNLALAQKGMLCDRMFAYPQQGRESLLPIYKMDYMTPMYGGEPYFYMGVVNTAQRFAFEAMEANPDYQKSTRCYQRLAVTAIVNGHYKVAAEYLRKLKRTHYYKKWAERMETFLGDEAKINADPLMGRLRRARYAEDFFFMENRVGDMLVVLLQDHPQNWMAWQYLLAYCMETKDIPLLAGCVAMMEKELPDMALPIHVQEALLFGWLQKKGTLEGHPWRISPSVQKRFVEFAKAANQERSVAEPAVLSRFGDTYGCYHLLGKEVKND